MIAEFKGRYKFLSNFWPCEVWLETKYPSVEHAYQASKTFNISQRKEIKDADTPGKAKRLGKKVDLRSDWEFVKLEVMYDLVMQKFFNNEELMWKLLDTDDEELVEGNTWGDTFWGVCNGAGENRLGKILMRAREEIRKETKKYCVLYRDMETVV